MKLRMLLPGGRIDRYVARLFVKSYLAAFFLVVGLYLIIDMATNLDEYLRPGEDGTAPATIEVMHFYALQLPFLYLQMSPFVTLVAGLFTAAKMTRFNEVVAALNAGVSTQRLLLAVFAGAGLLAVGMFGLRELATAEIGLRRDALLDHLVERRPAPVYENFGIKDEAGRSIRIRSYVSAASGVGTPEITGLSARFRTAPGDCSIHADRAWPLGDPAEGRWALEGGSKRDTGERQIETAITTLDAVRFTPEDVELHWKGREHPLELSFGECRRLLQRDPSNAQYRTLFHYHLTFPLAGLVLLAVGLPFVLRQERGGGGERIAVGFFLCVVYFGTDFVTRTLGLQGLLGPIHAGWLPVIAFGSLGIVLFGSMRS